MSFKKKKTLAQLEPNQTRVFYCKHCLKVLEKSETQYARLQIASHSFQISARPAQPVR